MKDCYLCYNREDVTGRVSVWTEMESAEQYTTVNQTQTEVKPWAPSLDRHRAGIGATPSSGDGVA